MLELLRIHNIILIDTAEIHFGPGFHVLSGETGAGKSALLQALALVTGAKADLSLLRQGTKQGYVEALFLPRSDRVWQELLEQSGLSWNLGEPILLRRELNVSGKTRCFYNDQLITQTLLKQIGACCLEIVGQQTGQTLRHLPFQRELIDLYGNTQILLETFRKAFQRETTLQEEICYLSDTAPNRLREQEIIERQRQELLAAGLQEEEEQLLINKHRRMQEACLLVEGLEGITDRIGGRQNSLIALIKREKQQLEQLCHLAPNLEEALQSFERAQIELHDIHTLLGRTLSNTESHPQNLEQVEERLYQIQQLKKRYGPSFAEILVYQNSLETRFKELEEAENRLHAITALLDTARKETEEAARALSQARMAQFDPFAREVALHLKALNMPNVQVEVRRHEKTRGIHGDEDLEIFFIPNLGEKELSICESSGGELSRIHLAIHMVLNGKTACSSLVFDEIDANIGGIAAKTVGSMLSHLSKEIQILCITHFPQVASFASHHHCIQKIEESGRTLTKIRSLSPTERKQELARMMGEPAKKSAKS